MKVLLTGATGFVGAAIAHELRAREIAVRALVRRPDKAGALGTLGVELAQGDMTQPESLVAAVDGCTHVINLVAIITGTQSDFERIMIDGSRSLLSAAEAAGVERFVQMSALGTSDATKDLVPYYNAKWTIEQSVEASPLAHVIVRPSLIFGKGGALPTFVKQVRLSPVVSVIGPGTQRIQPIWLDDVAAFFATVLSDQRAVGRSWEIGGPDVVTWNDLYLTIAKTLGKRRALVHVPFGLAKGGAALIEWLPGAPLTVDQVKMIEAGDNVCSNTDAEDTFHLSRVTLEDQLRRAA